MNAAACDGHGVMVFCNSGRFNKPGHTPPLRRAGRQPPAAPSGSRPLYPERSSIAITTTTTASGLVPRASSGRSSSAKSPQRSFSMMQSAMKIPGLASALHLIGVNNGAGGSGGGGGAASGDSTVAAAGSPASSGSSLPDPESETNASLPPPTTDPTQIQDRNQQQLGDATAADIEPPQPSLTVAAAETVAVAEAAEVAAAAELVNGLAAAAAASNGSGNGNGNGNGSASQIPQSQQQQQRAAHAAGASVGGGGGGIGGGASRPYNGYVNGVSSSLRGGGGYGYGGGGGDQGELPLSVVDPGSRAENNITPYTGGLPSLAGQIREIASTLRHINSLRMEYLDKISQQELELAAKDQVLRSKEERIQSLETEAADLRRSLAILHTAKATAEAEVQRLRAVAAAAANSPNPTLNAAAAAPPPPALPPPPTPAPSLVAAAPPPLPAPSESVTVAAKAPAAEPPPSLQPHPLTVPPAAVAASNPATVGTCSAAPAPTPAPPPSPPPPPPRRAPEVVLSYRSSWPDAYLHFNVDGRGWTAVPGVRMEPAGAKEYSVRVQGRSLEFVLTNGLGVWDSPAGGGPGRNYRIDSPGEYRLHYGALTQVRPWQP